jgi:hypothetical protein
MDYRASLEGMLYVGSRLSMDTKDLERLPQKLTVLSLKYIDRCALWSSLFRDDHVHWELVNQCATNILGDSSQWITLLSLFEWESVGEQGHTVLQAHPPLVGLRALMQQCKLDSGGPGGWTLVGRVFLLQLIRGLGSLHAVEMLTCQFFKRDTTASCTTLMAQQSETLYTPDQYLSTLRFLFQMCTVNHSVLKSNNARIVASREDKLMCLKMKTVSVVQGRPRLRDRVQTSLLTADHKTNVDSALNTWESYAGFCYRHQFPPTLNESIKTKLYFLASQTRWDWVSHLPLLLSASSPLLTRVADHPVMQPDVPVLVRVIEGMSMDGSPPFPDLTLFRTSCLAVFPVSHVQRMTLTNILQLYVAAYLPLGIWKEVWKELIGVISVQIIRDCEKFTGGTPMDSASVMRLLVS